MGAEFSSPKLPLILNPSAFCFERLACHPVSRCHGHPLYHLLGLLKFQCVAHPAARYTSVTWLSTISLLPAASSVTLAKRICICLPRMDIISGSYIFLLCSMAPCKLYPSQSKANANINVRCGRCLLPVVIQVLTQPSPLQVCEI